jgi:hypothetical protein
MIKKAELQKQLESFPDEFSIDELVERLIIIEKVQRGIEQSNNNQVVSEEELEYRVRKWFK